MIVIVVMLLQTFTKMTVSRDVIFIIRFLSELVSLEALFCLNNNLFLEKMKTDFVVLVRNFIKNV